MFTLSLLSRGNGQVVQSKQKRLEVFLEPEDYLNWTPQDKALISKPQDRTQVTRGCLPKTYSTRKGVLILYSEDFAEPSWKQKERKRRPRPYHRQGKKSGFVLQTLKDLTAAILAYGSERKDQKDRDWQPYLHFLSKPDSQNEQQIRPGYSAKRYLFSLFQNWTSGTLYKLQCSGYIRDPRLFQDNQLYLPNHLRRQQDLSAVPSKYRLLPVYPSVSTFWTQKEQRADEDASDLDNEESEDSDVDKEDCRAGKHWEEKVPLPPLKRKPPGRATWLNNEAYAEDENQSMNLQAPTVCQVLCQVLAIQVRRMIYSLLDTWMEPHQGMQALKKSQGHHGKSHPPLGSDSVFGNIETPQFLSQGSQSTFYGGTFPDRKTYLSGNVKISKSRHQMFPELLVERCVLPPVQPTINPEQNVPRKVKEKKVPKALKLPAITEEPPKAQDPLRSQLNDYGSPEELLILPLEVHVCAEDQPKDRGQRRESWNTECRPKANVDGKSLPKLSLQQTCYSQPPLTVHLPRDSGNDFSHPHSSTHEIRDSERKSSKIQQKTFGARSSKDLMDDGTNQSGLPEELIGSSQDPALGNILMGPAGDIVCQPLLGSVQSIDLPLQLDFASGQEYQFVNSSTNLGEACSSDQHVKKGNIHSEASLHMNTCETSSLTPEPAEKGAPQSLEAAVLKTGESQSFINKELEYEKGQVSQGRQASTITENHQHDPALLGNGRSEQKVRIQTEEPCPDSDVFPEQQQPTQGGCAPLPLEPPAQSLSVIETEKSKPQLDGSSTKEVKRQRDGNSESPGTSGLKQNLTPPVETIKELPLGNAPVAPKMGGTKRNPTEKQPPSRSRKGEDVPPKLGKPAEESSPERQMPEKTKRRKRNEVNKSKAPPNVGKGEKPQNKTEFIGATAHRNLHFLQNIKFLKVKFPEMKDYILSNLQLPKKIQILKRTKVLILLRLSL
uniref:Uncharacterized protein KIAA2012 homolog isoform X5 n=1 Tax=Phascolarctos cinereus TaxID=38626 RepID=A0A6P5J559_PHACI|nr:uncharacterized protein KIAA2012 homolog isoform X5 [Phascolarctos cinereus]